MFKYLLLLALGVALGYGYGWKDAQVHDKHVAERVLDRIGGESRALVSADADQTLKEVEKR